jgi:hypothetical protein
MPVTDASADAANEAHRARLLERARELAAAPAPSPFRARLIASGAIVPRATLRLDETAADAAPCLTLEREP